MKTPSLPEGIISGGKTQQEIDTLMTNIVNKFPNLFSNKTGKFIGSPIEIQTLPNACPTIQPQRKIPLHYVNKLKTEINMLVEDIIEGPIGIEEPGTYMSNLVIIDKKWDPNQIRITLDCQEVNKDIYQTHVPIPTSEELRHKLRGKEIIRFTHPMGHI